MTYDPLADRDFNAPVRGNATLWPSLIANDAEVFENFTPGFTAAPEPDASADARQYRWRMYGNLDNADMIVGVRGEGVTGPHTVTIATPGVDSDTVAVGTDGWYTATLSAQGPRQEVIVSSLALGGGTLEYNGLAAYHDVGAPVAGTRYPSGFRLVGSLWGAADSSVPSEIQSRLRTNPARLAVDRPVCVVAHVADTLSAVTVKDHGVWGLKHSSWDLWRTVGRLFLPRCDNRRRLFRVDAYTNETDAGVAEYSVRVGAREERWSGYGWHSWQVELGPQPHEIVAMIVPHESTSSPGNSNAAAIRTLTVWRTDL